MRGLRAGLTAVATATATAQSALAQGMGPAEAVTVAGFDPASVALGLAFALPLALPLVALQRWRIARLNRRLAEKEADAQRLFECLSAAPDGYYAFIPREDAAEGREHCSRRLAVLLGLPRGVDSRWDDVLDAFSAIDARSLDDRVLALQHEGDPFELEFTLPEGGRRVPTAN
jgi:hypothetical protein